MVARAPSLSFSTLPGIAQASDSHDSIAPEILKAKGLSTTSSCDSFHTVDEIDYIEELKRRVQLYKNTLCTRQKYHYIEAPLVVRPK